MGNWCCPASSPCDNVEERSGLLQDAAKGQATPAEIGVVVGFQHDTDADDVRKPVDHIETKEKEEVVTVQVKQSALPKEHGEIAQTTENEPIQTAARQPEETSPSTNSGYIENFSLTTQDGAIEITATENGPLEAERCTLDLPPKECARDTGEVSTEIKGVLAEETATVILKEHSDGITPEAEDRCSEVATLKAEISTVTEHITPETVDDDGSTAALNKAVDQPSRKSPCGNVDTSLTDTQLTPEVCMESSVSNHDENCIDSASTGDLPQLPSSSLASPSGSVIQGIDSENQSPAFHIEDSQEDRGHDSPEPSPGAEVTDPKQNGVAQNTTGLAKEPVPASSSRAEKSQNSIEEKEVDLKSELIGLNEVTALEDLVQEVEDEVVSEAKEQEDEDKENEAEEEEEMEESAALEAVTGVEMGKEKKEEDHQGPSTSADMEVEVLPVREQDGSVEMLGNSDDQDLYQGEEEISPGPDKKAGPEPLFQITFPKVEDRCSLAPTVDVLSYSEKEWKGNTAKSALIRKGYMELSQRFGSLRRVRGDNYCALRATLFQVLSHSTHLPAWLQDEDISMWPEELETREGLIGQWMFPSECRQGEGTEDAVQQLKRYMELLQNRWQAAVSCSSAEERQRLCERLFQGGEEELGLLEALKLLMLGRAAEIHTCMQEGGDVPIFCWLLFARDDSDCPRTFLSNHLSQVGFSGGLEQVEMFLLGHALQCTIQVYRLYMADTEEFVTYYPNDHKDDWPCVCLVTEDDRHYNVPVGEITGGLQVPEELTAADDH